VDAVKDCDALIPHLLATSPIVTLSGLWSQVMGQLRYINEGVAPLKPFWMDVILRLAQSAVSVLAVYPFVFPSTLFDAPDASRLEILLGLFRLFYFSGCHRGASE
jgi:hypothetical protein